MERLGSLVAIAPAVTHQHAPEAAAEYQGSVQACGSAADDDGVVGRGHPLLGCLPMAATLSCANGGLTPKPGRMAICWCPGHASGPLPGRHSSGFRRADGEDCTLA